MLAWRLTRQVEVTGCGGLAARPARQHSGRGPFAAQATCFTQAGSLGCTSSVSVVVWRPHALSLQALPVQGAQQGRHLLGAVPVDVGAAHAAQLCCRSHGGSGLLLCVLCVLLLLRLLLLL